MKARQSQTLDKKGRHRENLKKTERESKRKRERRRKTRERKQTQTNKGMRKGK